MDLCKYNSFSYMMMDSIYNSATQVVLKCKAVKHIRDFPYPVGNETKVSLPLRKPVMFPLAFLYP